MGRVVKFAAPGVVQLADYPEKRLAPHEVRLRTLFSGISAGTELTGYRGSNPYIKKRWESERRLFLDDAATLDYPLEGWGYEEVGEVQETGSDVSLVEEGDVVWGAWGHRSSHVVSEEWAAQRLLPDGLEPICGIFSHIGAIALNAVLDADIHVGESVAVFGQGVPGLIVGQLARLNGGTVIAIDCIAKRLDLAAKLGAAHTINVTDADPAEMIKDLTSKRGADVSIEISGSYRALHEAIRATAYNSVVVACGFFQGGAGDLRLGEEFHHNRIRIVCSQIFGVSPRLDHRWNERRLQQTVMGLAAHGRIDLNSLLSHVFPVQRADEAFNLVDKSPGEAVQVVLQFPH